MPGRISPQSEGEDLMDSNCASGTARESTPKAWDPLPSANARRLSLRASFFISIAVFGLACSATRVGASSCPAEGNGEFCTYQYTLEVNKETAVCEHLRGVLNWNSRRPFDYRGFGKRRLTSDVELQLDVAYPTSDVFDAVAWRQLKIFNIAGQEQLVALPVARVDIDNDGVPETVILQAPMYGSLKMLIVVGDDRLNHSKSVDLSEILRDANTPTLLALEADLIRLLIFKGTTYVMVYRSDHSRTSSGGTHQPPQSITIYRYIRGGERLPSGERKADLQTICRFDMIRVKAE